MAEFFELSTSDSFLKEFRCSICFCYFSSFPVQVLSSGLSICNSCSLVTDEPLFGRNLAMEAVLEKLSFPCKFKHHGCKERIPFGVNNEHEAACKYRSFVSPSVPGMKCTWQGNGLNNPDRADSNRLDEAAVPLNTSDAAQLERRGRKRKHT